MTKATQWRVVSKGPFNGLTFTVDLRKASWFGPWSLLVGRDYGSWGYNQEMFFLREKTARREAERLARYEQLVANIYDVRDGTACENREPE